MMNTTLHLNEHDVTGDRFESPFARTIKHLATPWTMGTNKIWLGLTIIDPSSQSNPHRHEEAEEVFYVISGEGRIRVGESVFDVFPGSCVFAPPNQEHQLINTGSEILKIVATTSPAPPMEQFSAVHLKS